VATYQTMTRSLLRLADRLAELGVTRVVMEATSNYWMAPFTCWKPRDWRSGWSTPRTSSTCRGRPKTDKLDAVWLAQRGMLRSSSCRLRQSGGCGI
jgi:transposase